MQVRAARGAARGWVPAGDHESVEALALSAWAGDRPERKVTLSGAIASATVPTRSLPSRGPSTGVPDSGDAFLDHVAGGVCRIGRKPWSASKRGELRVGVYDDRVLPRLVDLALGRPFEKTRARVAVGLTGQVLEVGFGSGRNVPHYPSAVTRVLAVEPNAAGRKLAAERIAASKVPVEFVGLDGQDLPLADESVDHVLVTWTLCTIPDAERALAEVRRVLRPGGSLHFVEHGRSPRSRIARWQDRITPTWGKVAGGCHLNRSIPDLIAGSDLTVTRLEAYRMPGLELFGFMFEGAAAKASPPTPERATVTCRQSDRRTGLPA